MASMGHKFILATNSDKRTSDSLQRSQTAAKMAKIYGAAGDRTLGLPHTGNYAKRALYHSVTN